MAYKYIFKYVYKGYDSAHMILKPHGEGYVYDEIERHLDFRYVTATEACWRIFGFWSQKKSHGVIRLALHEEDKHTVYYNSDEPEPPEPGDMKDTHLLAAFALCQKYINHGEYIQPPGCARRVPNPNSLLYTEIPQHFVGSVKNTSGAAGSIAELVSAVSPLSRPQKVNSTIYARYFAMFVVRAIGTS
jgi:hypothetical protein